MKGWAESNRGAPCRQNSHRAGGTSGASAASRHPATGAAPAAVVAGAAPAAAAGFGPEMLWQHLPQQQALLLQQLLLLASARRCGVASAGLQAQPGIES